MADRPRTCLIEAVLGGTVYPCSGDHSDGNHHFAADLANPCPAPFCRLPVGHPVLHGIPPGKPEIRKAMQDD